MRGQQTPTYNITAGWRVRHCNEVKGVGFSPDFCGLVFEASVSRPRQLQPTATEITENKMTNMPRYTSHKTVHAVKIAAVEIHEDKSATIAPADGATAFKTFPGWAERWKGTEDDKGYYVQYGDGFASWSPTKAFEDGYTADVVPHTTAGLLRKLEGHKVNPANDLVEVTVMDAPGAGNASHVYDVVLPNGNITTIKFQKGPIPTFGVNGLTQEVLLEIVADRLRSFQSGPFACEENGTALGFVEEAQAVLHDRTKARMARGVEGTLKA